MTADKTSGWIVMDYVLRFVSACLSVCRGVSFRNTVHGDANRYVVVYEFSSILHFLRELRSLIVFFVFAYYMTAIIINYFNRHLLNKCQ